MNPLKEHRAQKDLTQQQLADAIGVYRETVARWESGEKKIGAKSLEKISQATGIPAAQLRPDLAKLLGADE